MGIKRVVDTQFWTDDKVIEKFSPEDKLFMLYLMTNPHTTQLGIYELSKKYMAFETGYSTDTISVLLDRFETKYDLIKYSNETKEVAIKNYLRHSIIKGGKPVEDLLTKEISKVKDKSLLQYVFDGISTFDNLNGTVVVILPLLNQKENEKQNEIQNDNVSENDNDNDVSYHESYHESWTNRPQATNEQKIIDSFLKEQEDEYDSDPWNKLNPIGKKKVVFLSENQVGDLLDRLGLEIFDEYIDRLESFIIEKNAHVKNHYETILKWHREDSRTRS